MTDNEIIRSFPLFNGTGSPGFITNFLGIRTRTEYISELSRHDGSVEDYPIPTNFHASALEWAGALRAVLDASQTFVALELGAGWGPWLVSLARAAQGRGIQQIRLVGIEGSIRHLEYMHSHFIDNGLEPDRHTLMHAVVGLRDGIAEFPILADPSSNWGAAGVFSERTGLAGWLASRRVSRRALEILRGGAKSRRTEQIKCVSIPTLLGPLQSADLMHVDIQGDEYKVISASRSELKAKVKRPIIGTHSRMIEQELLEELAAQSWVLEADEACHFDQEGTQIVLRRDGCQVWRNTAFGKAR